MIDLRYMGLTLIAVFLALTIGLMTGSALGSPDKRDMVYEGLRGEFELLRGEIKRVQEENDAARRREDAAEQALRELLPLAVRNRLPGSVVGVVVCGGIDERPFWRALDEALEEAGATLGPVVRVPERLRPLTPTARERLAHSWPGSASTSPETQALAWIIHGLTRGSSVQAVEETAREVGIDTRSLTAAPVRRLIVLVEPPSPADPPTGEEDRPETAVIDAALAEGVRVVVAEASAQQPRASDSARRRDVPTVDNVDSAAGQMAVVLALAGADGQFGTKPGASRALPPLKDP